MVAYADLEKRGWISPDAAQTLRADNERLRTEIEQIRSTIRAFGRGDIVPITDKEAEIERLAAALEDAVETLEAMSLHTDNPLYARLRAALGQGARDEA